MTDIASASANNVLSLERMQMIAAVGAAISIIRSDGLNREYIEESGTANPIQSQTLP